MGRTSSASIAIAVVAGGFLAGLATSQDGGGSLEERLKQVRREVKVINLPTAKHHRLARVSLGMKNWMGVIGGQRRKWHQKLDQTVTDIAAVLAPTLSILDGSRVLPPPDGCGDGG